MNPVKILLALAAPALFSERLTNIEFSQRDLLNFQPCFDILALIPSVNSLVARSF